MTGRDCPPGEPVVLIGNASSGVQVLPAIHDSVKKVYVFMRNPTWIALSFTSKYARPDGRNFDSSEEQKQRWDEQPDDYLAYRKEVEAQFSIPTLSKGHTGEKSRQRILGEANSEKLATRPELLNCCFRHMRLGE